MKNILLGVVFLFSSHLVQADGQADVFYKEGVSVYKTNPARAYELFVLAAEAGHPAAMAGAGQCCETGSGMATNYAAAIDWYEKAVEHNSLKACEGLARIYASCNDPEFHDGQKAVKYATPVARKKPRDADALSLLAAAHARNMEFDKAILIGLKARGKAKRNNVSDLNKRQNGYVNNVPYPALATTDWIMRAADQGSVWAMCQLARKYDVGFLHDREKAKIWYEKAAEAGDSQAMAYLSSFYRNGRGGEKKMEEAFSWAKKSADAECAMGYYELGECHEAGAGVDKSRQHAAELYIQAYEAGYKKEGHTALAIGRLYGWGLSMPDGPDLNKAIEWYEKSFDEGLYLTYSRLISLYLNPDNSSHHDVEKALTCAKKLYEAAPNEWTWHISVAHAHAHAGLFDDAVDIQRKLISEYKKRRSVDEKYLALREQELESYMMKEKPSYY